MPDFWVFAVYKLFLGFIVSVVWPEATVFRCAIVFWGRERERRKRRAINKLVRQTGINYDFLQDQGRQFFLLRLGALVLVWE